MDVAKLFLLCTMLCFLRGSGQFERCSGVEVEIVTPSVLKGIEAGGGDHGGVVGAKLKGRAEKVEASCLRTPLQGVTQTAVG